MTDIQSIDTPKLVNPQEEYEQVFDRTLMIADSVFQVLEPTMPKEKFMYKALSILQ